MSRLIALPCLALLCLVLLGPATPALAQSEIHHCIGANGAPVFTDQPCAALRATPVSPAAATATASSPDASVSPAGLCAASVDDLRQSVIDAFARRDTVRLAGLILWDGYGSGAAIADIRALTTLMKQPLLEVETPQPLTRSASSDNDNPWPAPEDAQATSAADHLVLRTLRDGTEESTTQWRFDIVRRAGCLWLRNAN
ncbi:MAG: DUF4124 domain-containing protein [Rhodanobacter sp.]